MVIDPKLRNLQWQTYLHCVCKVQCTISHRRYIIMKRLKNDNALSRRVSAEIGSQRSQSSLPNVYLVFTTDTSPWNKTVFLCLFNNMDKRVSTHAVVVAIQSNLIASQPIHTAYTD